MENMHIHFRAIENYFFGHLAREILDLRPGGIAYKIGAPSADLNFFNVMDPLGFKDTLQRAHTFFMGDHLSFSICVPQELCTTEIRSYLEEIGAQESDHTTEMAVDLSHIQAFPELPNQLLIKGSEADLKDWQGVLAKAFKVDTAITDPYAQCHRDAKARGMPMEHLCLYERDLNVPIACLTLTLDQTYARLDDVGCLPEYQGKGYATILIQQALIQAQHGGARLCFLEASQAGYGTYGRCGFKPIGHRVLFGCQGHGGNMKAVETQ